MALTQNLAPEAYTRDTLVKAIEWISSQPTHMRERAKSAETIVSLYLAARRKAAATMDATATQENFKSDLKNLADDLRPAEPPSAPPQTANRSAPQVVNEPSAPAPVPVAPPAPAPTPSASTTTPAIFPSPVRTPAHRPVQNFQWAVDDRSLEMAREVQERLNLSLESEALRLLIKLGSERARDLFP